MLEAVEQKFIEALQEMAAELNATTVTEAVQQVPSLQANAVVQSDGLPVMINQNLPEKVSPIQQATPLNEAKALLRPLINSPLRGKAYLNWVQTQPTGPNLPSGRAFGPNNSDAEFDQMLTKLNQMWLDAQEEAGILMAEQVVVKNKAVQQVPSLQANAVVQSDGLPVMINQNLPKKVTKPAPTPTINPAFKKAMKARPAPAAAKAIMAKAAARPAPAPKKFSVPAKAATTQKYSTKSAPKKSLFQKLAEGTPKGGGAKAKVKGAPSIPKPMVMKTMHAQKTRPRRTPAAKVANALSRLPSQQNLPVHEPPAKLAIPRPSARKAKKRGMSRKTRRMLGGFGETTTSTSTRHDPRRWSREELETGLGASTSTTTSSRTSGAYRFEDPRLMHRWE
jgi:predicted regulator of Ras-like GTPase activity (Roadblock/LC7/MglB family)